MNSEKTDSERMSSGKMESGKMKSGKTPFLSIIIPAYNEAVNFKQGALTKAADYLKGFDHSYEVIVVDDGSSDNTRQLVGRFVKGRANWRLEERPHQGKAAAVAAGVRRAKARHILFTDFDQATPLSEVEKLLPFLDKGYDLVIGSREVKGAKREAEPFYRHLMGKVFNWVVRLVAFGGIADTQCGFKLFRAKAAKVLFNRLKVYQGQEMTNAFTGAFDVELLFLAQKYGYKIAEVPVAWRHFQTERVNPVKDSVRMFLDVLKIRLYDLLGRYEA